MAYYGILESNSFHVTDYERFRSKLFLLYFQKFSIRIADNFYVEYEIDGSGSVIVSSLDGVFLDGFWNSELLSIYRISSRQPVEPRGGGTWTVCWGDNVKSTSIKFYVTNGNAKRGPFSHKIFRDENIISEIFEEQLLAAALESRFEIDQLNEDVLAGIKLPAAMMFDVETLTVSEQEFTGVIADWGHRECFPEILINKKGAVQITEIAGDGDFFHGQIDAVITSISEFIVDGEIAVVVSSVPPNRDSDENYVEICAININGKVGGFHGKYDEQLPDVTIPTAEAAFDLFQAHNDFSLIESAFGLIALKSEGQAI